ncbi:GAL4 enhancer protein [Spiromyces aspiralis]|uniref:GAL4 enhancer protein n=1 Tax=Spiromyces aspiralis TaxID=68401 RepID=A0ACC1HMK1_9FUNG|nr:GAL4 enhancer protein [Spiromyces aspiralis]
MIELKMADLEVNQQRTTVEDAPEEELLKSTSAEIPAENDATVEEAVKAAQAAINRPPAGVHDRKVRKAMEKLKLKRVENISMVTMRRSNGILFSIQQPEVFQSPKSDTWIVFGEARMRSPNPQLSQLLQQQNLTAPIATTEGSATNKGKEAAAAAAEEEEEDVKVDETGVDPKDVGLVIKQANCSRAKAVQALKEADGDVVNAIMNLTM